MSRCGVYQNPLFLRDPRVVQRFRFTLHRQSSKQQLLQNAVNERTHCVFCTPRSLFAGENTTSPKDDYLDTGEKNFMERWAMAEKKGDYSTAQPSERVLATGPPLLLVVPHATWSEDFLECTFSIERYTDHTRSLTDTFIFFTTTIISTTHNSQLHLHNHFAH